MMIKHITFTLLLAFLLSGAVPAATAKAEPLRIMCLGDSITVGYTDNPHWKEPFKFGYRGRLYKLLKQAGYRFTFVGDSPQPWNKMSGDPSHDGTYKPEFDLRDLGQDHHQGGGGAPIGALKGWVSKSDPDLILLMIGINGISKDSPARIRGLVETILTAKPHAQLIVAQITPYVDTQEAKNKLVYDYNVYIRDTLVPEFANKGHKVSTVDMYSLFLTNPDDYESAVAAGIHSNNYNHPFNKEYDLMADRWFAAIEALGLKEAKSIDQQTMKKWSAPFRGWHYYPDHVIPGAPAIKGFENVKMVDVPTVYQMPGDNKWYMTFIGFDGKGYQSFVAESDDLLNWGNMRLAMGYGKKGEFDYGGCVLGAYLYEDYGIKSPRTLKKRNGKYWSLYGAYEKQGGYELDPGYEGVASSVDGMKWSRAKEQYILSIHEPDVGEWEKDCIYMPWLVEHEGKFYNFYNAKKMPQWVEQIGLATSSDLMDWKRYKQNPVLRVRPGGYDEKFCADGKVFRDGDHWVMFYFGVGKGHAHIMAAYSRDLIHWVADPEPLYKAGGHPAGLDKKHAHKISLVWNPKNETYYMFYNAVGDKGRGIGLITSKPLTD